jgi:hypothetical protein
VCLFKICLQDLAISDLLCPQMLENIMAVDTYFFSSFSGCRVIRNFVFFMIERPATAQWSVFTLPKACQYPQILENSMAVDGGFGRNTLAYLSCPELL